MKANVTTFKLGPAWAGNSVNAAIYRQGLCTRGGYQYAVYYTGNKELMLVQRPLTGGETKCKIVDRVDTLDDAHLTASIGVDAAGCVHLSYHHHNTPLNYRRMSRPHDVESFGPKESMTTCFELQVCYPFFLHPAGEGDAFYFLYRNGVAGRGEYRLKRYDHARQLWRDDERAVLSGMVQHPWTSSPYPNTPLLDAQGHLHLFSTWRTHALGEEQRVNNINLDYLRSEDGGYHWQSSRGRPLQRPVTQVNGETAVAIAPGSNMMNQSGAAIDRTGAPLAVYYTDDAQGIPQYYITRLRGGRWQTVQLSQRKVPFVLAGGGTLQIPISRPEVVVMPDNRPLVIYRGDISGQKLAAWLLDEATLEPFAHIELSEPVGFAEPVIDRMRWESEGVLSLYVQHCDQPSNEGVPAQTSAQAVICDWVF